MGSSALHGRRASCEDCLAGLPVSWTALGPGTTEYLKPALPSWRTREPPRGAYPERKGRTRLKAVRGPESTGRTREGALSQAPRLSAVETLPPAQLQVKDDWLGSPVLFKLFFF